jgi:hypothetical protein
MMAGQDNDVVEHLTRIEQSVKGMAGNIEIWSVDQAQNLALRAECIIQSKKTLKVPMNPQFDPNTKASSSRIENKSVDL